MNLFDKETTEQIYEILLNSVAQSGPFDGGCLIFAKGYILARGGELVHIGSRHNAVEHYGVASDGFIVDMDGQAESPKEWLDRFAENESLARDGLFYGQGYTRTEIPEDPGASKLIAKAIAGGVA